MNVVAGAARHRDAAAVGRPTTASTIARPRPVEPVAALVRDASPRVNRWNRLARSSARDARAVVGDRAPRTSGARRCTPAPTTVVPAGVCGAGVGQQVGQHLVQPVLVAATTVDRLLGQVEPPVVVRAGGVRVADGVDHEHAVRSTGSALQRPARRRGGRAAACPRPAPVMRCDSDSTRPIACGDVVGQRLAGAADQLGVAADRGQRRAQLVAGVGDELAHLRLGLVPGGERLPDVAEQLVERRADLADLGARGRCPRRAPARRAPPRRGPAAACATRSAVRGDPVERSQLAADEHQRRRQRRRAERARRRRSRRRRSDVTVLVTACRRQGGRPRSPPSGVGVAIAR